MRTGRAKAKWVALDDARAYAKRIRLRPDVIANPALYDVYLAEFLKALRWADIPSETPEP